MIYRGLTWQKQGFAAAPARMVAPKEGLLLYRTWGLRTAEVGSSESGSGFFSLEKPTSVLDAERRFNIVDWDNGVNFVSTFRLKSGFHYWLGMVAHGKLDLAFPASQVFVEPPLEIKLEIVRSKEVLRHDSYISSRDGNA